MVHFPITCIDDFYSDPDEVRRFALSCDFDQNTAGNYPGVRTKMIHYINENFFNTFCAKLFSLFYNYKHEHINWIVETTFQKIYPFSVNKTSLFNEGWVHLDSDSSIAAGVIYLNPDPYPEAGTSFYEMKDHTYKYDGRLRDTLYATGTVDKQAYIKEKYRNARAHQKILEIKNRYNRCSFYGAQYPHRESNFVAHDTEPRLTQAFFIRDVKSMGTPLQRFHSHDIMY